LRILRTEHEALKSENKALLAQIDDLNWRYMTHEFRLKDLESGNTETKQLDFYLVNLLIDLARHIAKELKRPDLADQQSTHQLCQFLASLTKQL
jgi:hypothetical protein